MKPVALFDAWTKFWPLLFPDTRNREVALEGWVRTNIVQPDAITLAVGQDDQAGPKWGGSLIIKAAANGAEVSIGGWHLGVSPWFANDMAGFSPQWKVQRPIERLTELGARKDATSHSWASESSKLVRNVTLRVGAHICAAPIDRLI